MYIYRPGRAREVYNQVAKTPELKMLDLGVWYNLHHRVLAMYREFSEYRNRKELLDHLLAVIEEEFWRIGTSGPMTTSRP